MKIKPILTEKSMNMAKSGHYSFWVEKNLRKNQIKKIVSDMFKVKVVSVSTMNYKGSVKTSIWRKTKLVKPARKKAIVKLDPKDKISLFGEEDHAAKKKKSRRARKNKEK
jgi:large subunit ribosomal protein L23